MTFLSRNSLSLAGAILLLFLITSIMPYAQQHDAEAGEGECIDYESSDNTITVNCNSSFLDVVQTINDADIIENLGNGEYLLIANLEVADDITFEMNSNQDGLLYLKIAGENGIIVYGSIA